MTGELSNVGIRRLTSALNKIHRMREDGALEQPDLYRTLLATIMGIDAGDVDTKFDGWNNLINSAKGRQTDFANESIALMRKQVSSRRKMTEETVRDEVAAHYQGVIQRAKAEKERLVNNKEAVSSYENFISDMEAASKEEQEIKATEFRENRIRNEKMAIIDMALFMNSKAAESDEAAHKRRLQLLFERTQEEANAIWANAWQTGESALVTQNKIDKLWEEHYNRKMTMEEQFQLKQEQTAMKILSLFNQVAPTDIGKGISNALGTMIGMRSQVMDISKHFTKSGEAMSLAASKATMAKCQKQL